MKISNPPILPETFEVMVAPWLTGIAKRDIVVVVSYPASDRQRRVLQLLTDIKLQKRYLGNPDRFLWVNVDFRVDPIDDVIDLEAHVLREITSQTGFRFSGNPSFASAVALYERTSGKKIVLTAFGCEKLLRVRAAAILIWCTIQCRVDHLRMLLFFEANLFASTSLELLGSVPAFQPRIVFLPLYAEADVRQFIRYLTQNKWGFAVTPAMTERIVRECGGVLLLVKEALWYLRDHPGATPEAVFTHTEMQLTLASLWRGFAEEERDMLERIVTREELYGRGHQASIAYLEQMHFIAGKREQWQLTMPLLAQYVREMLGQKKHLAVGSKNELLLDGVPVNAHFSRTQRRLLAHFLSYPGETIPRDRVAALLWPYNTQERYSDWAIDSAISRLRLRLAQLGLPAQKLKTKKGKGFAFSPPV